MHVRTWWLILVGLLLLSGCTWQRIEAPPAYAADSFPLTIALMPSDDPASKEMANLLSSEFKTIGEFDGVIYPYRSGDEVDCILNLNAVGSAEGKGAGAGVVTGLTFGLAGTVVGPQTTIIHDIDFYLSNGAEQTDHYKIHIESEAEFGVFANIQEVAQKQTALQLRRIAIAMSEKLNMDRSSVMHTCTGYIGND